MQENVKKNEQGALEATYLTPEQLKRRRQRSVAIGLVLGAMVVLFFSVTVVRLMSNLAARHMGG